MRFQFLKFFCLALLLFSCQSGKYYRFHISKGAYQSPIPNTPHYQLSREAGAGNCQFSNQKLQPAVISFTRTETNTPHSFNGLLANSSNEPAEVISIISGQTYKWQQHAVELNTDAAKSPEKPESKLHKISKSQNRSRGNDNGLFLTFSAGAVALLLGTFRLFAKASRKISDWAKVNKRHAQAIIILSNLLLGAAAVFSGKFLYETGLNTTALPTNLLIGTGGLAALLYPIKGRTRGIFSSTYLKQKLFSLLVLLISLLLCISAGNRSAAEPNLLPLATKAFKSIEQKVSPGSTLAEKYFADKIKQDIQQEHQQKPSAGSFVKVLLTILTVALLIALLMGLAALSCSISCHGMDGLAIVVLFSGLGGLIFLGIYIFRSIWGRKNPWPEIR